MKEKFRLFGRDSLREKLVCGLAAAMFPTVIFIYFCAQNLSELAPLPIALSVGIFFLITVVSYLVSLIVFRKAFPALVFCVICWLGFYCEPVFKNYVWRLPHGNMWRTTLTFVFSACCAAVLLRKTRDTIKWACLLIATCSVILAINLTVLLRAFVQENRLDNLQIPIKTNFSVDSKTQSPNIYWIHADGMLSFKAVEKYYGDKQEKFLSELAERGFMVNPIAEFEAAHSTRVAIPILTNPYSYDNWINGFSSTHEKAMGLKKSSQFSHYLRTMRMNCELQNAFVTKQYGINIVGAYDFYYPVKGGNMWLLWLPEEIKKVVSSNEVYSSNGSLALINTVIALQDINFYFELSLRPISGMLWKVCGKDWDNYRVQMDAKQLKKIYINELSGVFTGWDFVSALYDVLYGNYRQRKLTIVHDITPHCPFVRDVDGIITTNGDGLNPLDYHPQHIWSGKVLINVIDMILEVEPDAVIVIQSDHGLHGNTEEDFKEAFGEDADPIELWNSTMSAIRVPAQYRTGEEHYAMENPLNISRYLVNSFVGRNYDYLPAN